MLAISAPSIGLVQAGGIGRPPGCSTSLSWAASRSSPLPAGPATLERPPVPALRSRHPCRWLRPFRRARAPPPPAGAAAPPAAPPAGRLKNAHRRPVSSFLLGWVRGGAVAAVAAIA